MSVYYVGSGGSDSNGGTDPSTDQWLTIQKAANTIAAGDIAYIKNDKTYSELVTLSGSGDRTTGNKSFIGYGSTIGDNGLVTIDGASTRAYGVSDGGASTYYYVFKNIKVANTTSHGWNMYSARYVSFYRCETNVTGDKGFYTRANMLLVDCTAASAGSGTTDFGFYGFAGTSFIRCHATDCNIGFALRDNNCCYCLVTDISADAYRSGFMPTSNGWAEGTMYHCVVDGDNDVSTEGYYSGYWGMGTAINCIFFDCGYGMVGNTDDDEGRSVVESVGFASCGTDTYGSLSYGEYDTTNKVTQTGDPFTSSAGGDYTLHATNGSKFMGVGSDLSGDNCADVDLGLYGGAAPAPAGASGISQGLHAIETGVNA